MAVGFFAFFWPWFLVVVGVVVEVVPVVSSVAEAVEAFESMLLLRLMMTAALSSFLSILVGLFDSLVTSAGRSSLQALFNIISTG